MKEVWKDVDDYEGIYQVSNKGRIRNIKKTKFKYIDGYKNKSGSTVINLKDKKRNIAKTLKRLVAIAFVPNPNNFFYVQQIKKNDDISSNNLEWVKHPRKGMWSQKKKDNEKSKTRPKTAEPKITYEKINEKLNDLGENINTYSKSYTKDRYIPIIDK
jgi:hypothetical protein